MATDTPTDNLQEAVDTNFGRFRANTTFPLSLSLNILIYSLPTLFPHPLSSLSHSLSLSCLTLFPSLSYSHSILFPSLTFHSITISLYPFLTVFPLSLYIPLSLYPSHVFFSIYPYLTIYSSLTLSLSHPLSRTHFTSLTLCLFLSHSYFPLWSYHSYQFLNATQ